MSSDGSTSTLHASNSDSPFLWAELCTFFSHRYWPNYKTAGLRHLICSSRGHLKCDGTRAETRLRLSAKRTSPFKSAGASVQSTTGSRDVHISGSNAGYTMFRGSVKSTGYPLHSSVSPSLPLPCVTVCHHISTGFYHCQANIKILPRQAQTKTYTAQPRYSATVCFPQFLAVWIDIA